MDSLKDGSAVADISRGSETKTADQASTEIREYITVEIWHNHDSVRVGSWVLYHSKAYSVQEIFVVFYVREVLCYYSARLQEHAVRHLHDGCLVDGRDMWTSAGLGVLEGVSSYTLGCFVSDELD